MNKINFLRIICITTFVVSMVMSIILCLPGNWDSADASTTDEVKSKAYCLMDYGTGEVLLEKESKQHLPIASVTKTMTLLLTFEAMEQGKFGIEDMLLSTQNASGMGGSQVFLEPDTEYKVNDLLYAVIMSSANDASVVFAEAIAGSESAFVDMMNKKAQSLGLVDTNFVNCTGLPANNHYSCAHDVAVIMRELVGHQEYFNYTKEILRDFVHPTGRVTQMTNTNKLMRSYNGCDAGKTGSTVEAGYCLSATAVRNNMRLISVVLGADNSKQRFADCST
ncbi:MAG: D-alanyl-D-alanine carboxypeptidase family protein, partial [Christensenellales bacterium]